MLSRARELTTEFLTAESIKPVELNFFLDSEFLGSLIALGFVKESKRYATLTYEQVRAFLENLSKESKTTVSLDQLDRLVKQNFRTKMKNKNANARTEDLFADYFTLLTRNGLTWFINNNPNVSVQHVLSYIRPQMIHDRLITGLYLAEYDLRKYFKGF